MNDSEINRLIMQAPFELVRQFVAERATCGTCKFWDRESSFNGRAECDNRGVCDTAYRDLSPARSFGCIHWQPRTDIEAT